MWSTQNGREGGGVKGVGKFKVCTMLKIVPRNLFFSGCNVVICFVSPVCVQNSDALVSCRCRSQNILFVVGGGSVHTESQENAIQQCSVWQPTCSWCHTRCVALHSWYATPAWHYGVYITCLVRTNAECKSLFSVLLLQIKHGDLNECSIRSVRF